RPVRLPAGVYPKRAARAVQNTERANERARERVPQHSAPAPLAPLTPLVRDARESSRGTSVPRLLATAAGSPAVRALVAGAVANHDRAAVAAAPRFGLVHDSVRERVHTGSSGDRRDARLEPGLLA